MAVVLKGVPISSALSKTATRNALVSDRLDDTCPSISAPSTMQISRSIRSGTFFFLQHSNNIFPKTKPPQLLTCRLLQEQHEKEQSRLLGNLFVSKQKPMKAAEPVKTKVKEAEDEEPRTKTPKRTRIKNSQAPAMSERFSIDSDEEVKITGSKRSQPSGGSEQQDIIGSGVGDLKFPNKRARVIPQIFNTTKPEPRSDAWGSLARGRKPSAVR